MEYLKRNVRNINSLDSDESWPAARKFQDSVPITVSDNNFSLLVQWARKYGACDVKSSHVCSEIFIQRTAIMLIKNRI